MDRGNGPRKVSQSHQLQEAAITPRTQTVSVLSPISTIPTQRLSASGSTPASSSSLHSHKKTPTPNHASAPRPHSLLNASPALNAKKERPTSYYSYFSSPTWVSSDVPSMLDSDGEAADRPRPLSMFSALDQKLHLPGTFTSQPAEGASQAMISHSHDSSNASLDELHMSSAVEEATSSSSTPRISLDLSARNIPLSLPDNRAPLSFVVDNDLADDLVASWSRGEFQDAPSNEIASAFLKKSYSRSATPGPGNYHYQKRCTSSMSFHPEVLALSSGTGSELKRMSVELQPESETEESEISVAGRNISGTEEGSGLYLSSAFLADVVSLNGDLDNYDNDDDGTYIELEGDTTTTDTSGPFSPSSSQFRSTWSSRSSAASTSPPTSPIDPVYLQTHIRTYGDEFPPLFRGLDSLSNLHFEDGKTTLITPFVSPTAFINPRPAPKPPVIVDSTPEVSALRAIFVFGPRKPSTRVAAPSRTPTITQRDRANSTTSTLRRFNSLKSRPKKTVLVDESGVQVHGHQPRFGGSMMNLNMLLRGEDQSIAESQNSESASKKHSFLSRLKHGLGWKTHSKGRSV
ncbi:hypothetical protein VNI00_010532 [Paramarasmius palmivorus]|uniref:Uncharacterized protein n=1 Tax=Paramarasmius palmivorus TaxID=297713 RepID=A0AAW0CH07_9AGAR